MRERGPDVKVVGGLSPEEENIQTKEESRKLKGFLYEAHLDDLEEYQLRKLQDNEFPKSPEQKEIIERVNEATDDFRRLAGVKPYDIPEKNFHIVPRDLYDWIEESMDSELGHSSAMTIASKQMMVFTSFARRHPIIFANEAFHEVLHLKSPIVFEKEKTEIQTQNGKKIDSYKRKLYRFGFEVGSALAKDEAGKKHSHFSGLNEAFVSLCEKYFTKQIIREMAKKDEEIKWLETEESRKLKEKIATKEGFSADDIFWLSKDGESWCRMSYPWQREVLEYIITKIQAEFPEQYADTGKVLLEFNKSYFTGRLLPLARLVKKVFGKGSFEVLGMMTPEKKSALLTLEYFKRHRPKKTNKK